MENRLITINEACRSVNIPEHVAMCSFEIAHLFGVTTQAINANIASLMKAKIVRPEMRGCTMIKFGIITPEYFGLDMVTALAYRVDSYQADIFREWVLNRMQEKKPNRDIPIFIQLSDKEIVC